MKIVINKGETIESAMKSIKEFLLENYSEYPILKNTMNTYVTLKNAEGQICPDNEKEYVLSKGQATDVFTKDKMISLDKRLSEWECFVHQHKRDLLTLKKNLDADKKYIDTAEEKGRKVETVEKRKVEYKKNKLKLEKGKEKENTIDFLDSLIQENRMQILYIKSTDGSPYKYTLETIFVFNNINGYVGYFDHRGLHEGLPSYYK